jgi:hypothetical protein
MDVTCKGKKVTVNRYVLILEHWWRGGILLSFLTNGTRRG